MGRLSDLPAELVLGWALWFVGGLGLTIWFLRRSAAPRLREVPPHEPVVRAPKLSGTHPVAGASRSGSHAAAARPYAGTPAVAAQAPSGTHAGLRPQSTTQLPARPPSGPHAAQSKPQPAAPEVDPFDELRALLDRPDEPPRAG